MGKTLVSGDIVFAERPELPSDATAYVRLLDTSAEDALSSKIAEQILNGIAQKANQGEAVPFVLYGKIEDDRASYTISVLVDVGGDGAISPGDFINMQSYPVLTFGYPNHVSVEVKRIN